MSIADADKAKGVASSKNCAHDRENISLSLLTTQFEI